LETKFLITNKTKMKKMQECALARLQGLKN
jgi:hypothetical protein